MSTDEYVGLTITSDITKNPTEHGWECSRCERKRTGYWSMKRAIRSGKLHDFICHHRSNKQRDKIAQ